MWGKRNSLSSLSKNTEPRDLENYRIQLENKLSYKGKGDRDVLFYASYGIDIDDVIEEIKELLIAGEVVIKVELIKNLELYQWEFRVE